MSQAARKFVAALALAGAFPVMVHAAYFKWETVELPASSGASCGNGTPYRFFVNRTPFTSKTVVIFEGGGACWDQNACLGKGNGALGLSILSASTWSNRRSRVNADVAPSSLSSSNGQGLHTRGSRSTPC